MVLSANRAPDTPSLEWSTEWGWCCVAQSAAEILVVVPSLGRRLDSLGQALDSSISQEEVAIRVVAVIPDSSTEAITLARSRGVEVISDPGRGMSAAINAGIAARGKEQKYIWLGDDDSFRPGGLRELSALLDDHPEAVVAYGACDYVDDGGRVLWTSQAGDMAKAVIGIGPNLIPHPAAMMRLDVVEQVGGYDEQLGMVMDLDLLLRLKKIGPFVSTRAVVSAFGWHPGSLTVQDRKGSATEARMVKRRHLGPVARMVEPLWEYPVNWASRLAARRLNRRGMVE